jgi:hypothetical protein
MSLLRHLLFGNKLCATMWIAGAAIVGCSSRQLEEKLQPTERAVQPTVSAVQCGGGSVKATIESCRAKGGNYGHCAIVASRAGVSDATACYSYATQIHQRREQLVGQEDQVDAQIRYLQDVNADTRGLNAELNVRIQEVTARTDTAVDSLAHGEMTSSDLDQLRSILDIEVSSAQKQLDAASGELRAAEQYRAHQPPPTAALDAEIAQLQSLLDTAQRQTRELVAQRQRVGKSDESQ